MRRKVIQLAGRTLVVSLPIKWVKSNKIIKGQEVEVIEKGEKLIIANFGEKPDELSIILNVSKKVFDKRHVRDLYMRGYDEVRINYENPEQVSKELQELNILGYEIINQGKNFCVIKNISTALESEFDTMLRRSFLLTKELGKGLVDYFDGEDIELKHIRALEEATNKFTSFCLRILNKQGYSPHYKVTFLYVITRELEAIADIYKYLIDDLVDKPSKKAINYFKNANKFFETFYDLFYKYDEEVFREFYNTRKKLIEEGRKLVQEGGIDSSLAHHSLNLVVAVYNISGPFRTMNVETIYT